MQGAPARSPATAGDPNNQGDLNSRLLMAFEQFTNELAQQNQLLRGITTLAETNFIGLVLLAQHLNLPRDHMARGVAGERAAIATQFGFTSGK